MIRPISAEDTAPILALAESVGLFSLEEVEQLRPMVEEAVADGEGQRPFWLVDAADDGLVSVAYCEPERMAEGTWNLQLIAVRPDCQGQGRGGTMLEAVKQELLAQGARLLLVDTLGSDEFESVRKFYRSQGFVEEARIRDFYAEGADKVTFWKALS